ncbi:SIR2 family protein [Arthrospiribacter ruber]|uniref:SIR2 family protein n=1 Tax=Arthrospiribacter ruber TaxID=2487934 RepID=A0A951M6V3_9BACT|nr:SIR2 family protein [Arthrospiribacter ruber]MBW3466616.1 SIR2 family protein [Arthrospiribacter ruber]
MRINEFIQIFPFRASNLAWLFGAGSSVSAGLPTAYDLVWDFKRRIYSAEQGYELRLFDNLSDSGLRNQIQNYFDGKQDYPEKDSTDEYSFYFKKAFVSPSSRREYIESLLSGVKLSYGHKIIGALMKLGYAPLIFTTNFDKAFENAAIEFFKKSEGWFCADLDNAESGLKYFQSNNSPLIVKLHGDFYSERLKNTDEELQSQDSKLRSILSGSSLNKGLAVMGYSGRDNSIMEALKEGLNKMNPYPHGIFWFIRTGEKPLQNVVEFLDDAKKKGVETNLIEIETFDTAWGDFIKGISSIPDDIRDKLNENYYRFENRPLPSTGTKLPLLRLNALEIKKFPATARIFKCDIGGLKEVKSKIKEKEANIVAIRKRTGVIGFGSDSEFKRVFGDNKEMDVFNIPDIHLRYDDSLLKNLLVEALSKAICNKLELKYTYRRSQHIVLINPKRKDSDDYMNLSNVIGGVFGSVPNSKLKWAAGVIFSIQYKLNKAHLMLSPTIIVTKPMEREEAKLIAPFVKEKMAIWYNNKYNLILDAWLSILFGKEQHLNISLFNNEEGINAHFRIYKQTNYTKFS